MTSSASTSSPPVPAQAVLLRALLRPEWGLVLAIATVVVLTALVDDRHNYWSNPGDSAVNILRQTAMLGIFALGAAVVIISGGIDLSAGSVIAFSGTVCAAIMLLLAPEQMAHGKPVGPGVVAAAIAGTLVVGLLIGSLHAWLITVIDLPPFVATLATLVGLRSLGRALAEAVTQPVYHAQKYQIEILDQQFR